VACFGNNAAAAAADINLENHSAFHDAYPLVVMQREPRFGRRGWHHESLAALSIAAITAAT
jgi:hypothetical protein